MSINIKQGDIIYVDFEPEKGSEIKKEDQQWLLVEISTVEELI